MNKEKLIVVFTVMVDVLGFGIVIPILPFYVSSFGASPFTVTLLFSVFALFAFLSSPLLGALSDRLGRRPVLLFSIASTAVGWFVFASAESILLLFVGRIIDGAAAGNITVAQSCLVDIAKDEKERAANLGIFGAAFGIGFMVGPMLGGVLSTVSHAFPFWVAGFLATANAGVAYFLLPETNRNLSTHGRVTINPIAPLVRSLTNLNLRPLFLGWVLFAVAFSASQSVFALYAQNFFGLDAFATSMLFTGVGIFMALNQAVLLKQFWLPRFSEERLATLMNMMFGFSLLLMGAGWLPLFYLSIPLMATSQSILRVVVASLAAGFVEPHRKGEALGILTSLMAASMVVGPVGAGFLFELGEQFPYFAGALLMLAAHFLTRKAPQHTKPVSD